MTSSVTPSTLRSNSDSDSGSVISQPCLACGDGRLTQSERSLDTQPDTTRLHVQHSVDNTRSRSSSRPEDRSEAEHLSYMRRSSAPEIDHESPVEDEVRSRREIYTRSLGRTRRQRVESGRSSDGESTKQDSEELQRARAHLKETLEGKIGKLRKIEAEKNQSETKAVVHRSDGHNSHKTLDSEAIKQYQNIKQNPATLPGGKQRYSGMFSEGAKAVLMKERHPTGQGTGREHPSIYKQSSFDNLTKNTESTTLPRDRHEGFKNNFLHYISHSLDRCFVEQFTRQSQSSVSSRAEEARQLRGSRGRCEVPGGGRAREPEARGQAEEEERRLNLATIYTV